MTSQKNNLKNQDNFLTIFLIFLRLGLTSFGGPVAHLGYFREAFVEKRQWLSDRSYADLVALCQFLPGPASSQVGLALGMQRGGYAGAAAAWLGFTLPSAMALIIFALGLSHTHWLSTGALQGLKIVALAVVAQAVWGMAKSLCPDTPRITLMALSACLVLINPTLMNQLVVIIICGLIGWRFFAKTAEISTEKTSEAAATPTSAPNTPRRTHWVALGLFFALLLLLPLFTSITSNDSIAIVDTYYRTGSLVFGGGHVVLPLLQAEVVPQWVSDDVFLAGYGATQAVPGPLFTFAAFLGAASNQAISGVTGGLLALVAIFLPSFLLIVGVLPFWEKLRHQSSIQAALTGINAGVVGILLAALYNPVWTSAIRQPSDVAMALIAFVALMFWRCPPWLAVILGAAVGALVG